MRANPKLDTEKGDHRARRRRSAGLVPRREGRPDVRRARVRPAAREPHRSGDAGRAAARDRGVAVWAVSTTSRSTANPRTNASRSARATASPPAGAGAPAAQAASWTDSIKDSLGGLLSGSGRKDSIVEAVAKSARAYGRFDDQDEKSFAACSDRCSAAASAESPAPRVGVDPRDVRYNRARIGGRRSRFVVRAAVLVGSRRFRGTTIARNSRAFAIPRLHLLFLDAICPGRDKRTCYKPHVQAPSLLSRSRASSRSSSRRRSSASAIASIAVPFAGRDAERRTTQALTRALANSLWPQLDALSRDRRQRCRRSSCSRIRPRASSPPLVVDPPARAVRRQGQGHTTPRAARSTRLARTRSAMTRARNPGFQAARYGQRHQRVSRIATSSARSIARSRTPTCCRPIVPCASRRTGPISRGVRGLRRRHAASSRESSACSGRWWLASSVVVGVL